MKEKIKAAQVAMKEVDPGNISPEGEAFTPTWLLVAEMPTFNLERILRVFEYVGNVSIPILSGTEKYYRNVAQFNAVQQQLLGVCAQLRAQGVKPENYLIIHPLRYRARRDPEFFRKALNEISVAWNCGGGCALTEHPNGKIHLPGIEKIEPQFVTEYEFWQGRPGANWLLPWWLEQKHQPPNIKKVVMDTIFRLHNEADQWICKSHACE